MLFRVVLFFCSFPFLLLGQQNYFRAFERMGSSFEITLVAQDSLQAEQLIDMGIQEITRIEQLISSWDPTSQTSRINQNAGVRPVKVDSELLQLIVRSLLISKQTAGAFDISYAAVDKVWKFDGRTMAWPPKEILEEATKNMGYQNIDVDVAASTVYLKKKGMKIGFGAIGKGYAADRVKALLQGAGVAAGLINASGDMQAWGTQANGQAWSVGIINPLNKQKVFSWFDLKDRAVVTSGDYERFVILDGKRHGHIIDPRTAKPAKGIISATVFAPKAELADALATSIYVLGKENGMFLIDQLPEVEALMIDDQGEMISSKNLTFDTYE